MLERERKILNEIPKILCLTIWKVGYLVKHCRWLSVAKYLSDLTRGSLSNQPNDINPVGRVTTIHGFELHLHPYDPGISRTLRRYGVHEAASTTAFARELTRLRSHIDQQILVLDIGANIGYYALLADRILAPTGRVIAFEPEPTNVSLLEHNMQINNAENRIGVVQAAVGRKAELIELYLADHSNRHTVKEPPKDGHNARYEIHDTPDNVGTLPVEQVTIDEFLEANEIPPTAVNVVRMDLEGYETDVLAGMKKVLNADHPLVIFIEVHPVLSDDELNVLFKKLDEGGLEPVSAVTDESVFSLGSTPETAWHGVPLASDSLNEIKETIYSTGQPVELILRR